MNADAATNKIDEVNHWIHQFLRTGEKQYLGNVYEKHKQQLFFQCVQILTDPEDARDITADAFIRAFERIDSFDLNRPFFPWLSQIARYLCIDFLRRKRLIQFRPIDTENHAGNSLNSLDELVNDELKKQILKAIQKLNGPQKTCFCLFYIHEKSYKEIVEQTGYSENKVRSHIQNGRRKVRLLLKRKKSNGMLFMPFITV